MAYAKPRSQTSYLAWKSWGVRTARPRCVAGHVLPAVALGGARLLVPSSCAVDDAPTTGPDDGLARGACLRAVRSVAAARRLEVTTLHSKLTPWVVLDETYLGAYGRFRHQYQILGPTAGASAPRRLTPWPNNLPTPRLTPSTPCAPWPKCPCTRSSTRGRGASAGTGELFWPCIAASVQ